MQSERSGNSESVTPTPPRLADPYFQEKKGSAVFFRLWSACVLLSFTQTKVSQPAIGQQGGTPVEAVQ